MRLPSVLYFSSISRDLIRYITNLIPSSIARFDEKETWRVQYGKACAVLGISVCSLLTIIHLAQGLYILAIFQTMVAFIYFICLKYFEKGNLKRGGVLITQITFVYYIFFMYVDGGIGVSGMFYWIPSVFVLALILTDRKQTAIYVGIMVVSILGLYILADRNIYIPTVIPTEHRLAFVTFALILSIVVQYWEFLILERLRSNAYYEVHRQRELLIQQARYGEKLTKELQESNNETRRLYEQQQNILYMVTHDLKNPLGAIKGLAQMLSSEKSNYEEGQELVKQIQITSEEALNFIQEMLTLGALEERSKKMVVETCDIVQLAQNVLDTFEPKADEKFLDLATDFPQNLFANVDVVFMKHIIENLISNAIKFSPHHTKIIVRLSKQHNQAQDRLRLEVQDNGPGIAKTDQEKLFQRFVKLSARPTGGEHSSGLGLSIVKQLVEAQHGEVQCISEINNGACFIVELPIIR